jgi:hypothetical protein
LTRNGILALDGASDRIDCFARGASSSSDWQSATKASLGARDVGLVLRILPGLVRSKVDDLESRCRPQRVDRIQNQLLPLNGVKPAS